MELPDLLLLLLLVQQLAQRYVDQWVEYVLDHVIRCFSNFFQSVFLNSNPPDAQRGWWQECLYLLTL